MERIELEVTSREVLGKKVSFLRRQGITPVHVFGHGIESLALQCDTAKLQHALAQAGQTRIITLKLGNERRPRPVVVREVQRALRKGELLHVDFYQVKMAEKIRVEVPVLLVGEAPALKAKGNALVQELHALTIECFPARIPASVELALSPLTEPDQVIRVKNIELDEEITVVSEPELVVARISSQPVERIEEEVKAEETVETLEVTSVGEEERKEV